MRREMAEPGQIKFQCPECNVFQFVSRYSRGRKLCDLCLATKQRYREKHKEEIKEKQKEYYERHKEEINAKVECKICKCFFNKQVLQRHNKTKKHLNNLWNMIPEPENEPEP